MNEPTYSRRAPSALILSSDALGAALLGGVLELLGYRAAFPREGESNVDALRRLKARAVLVDVRDDLLEDGLLGPAMMTGARIVLFGPPSRVRDLRVLAAKYGALIVALPDDVDALAHILSPPPITSRRGPEG